MANIFVNLKEYISKEIDNKVKLSPINKNNLIELITINIQSLNNIKNSMDVLNNSFKSILTLYSKNLNSNRSVYKNIDKNIVNIPLSFSRHLLGNAKIMEDKSPLSSIKKTIGILINTNETMLKNINDIISNDSIVVNNVRVLDTYCITIMEQTNTYSMFCYDLLGLIGAISNNLTYSYPKYRQERMIANYPIFTGITNQLCDSAANISIMKDVRTIKSNGYNFKLNDTGVGAVSSINDNILSRNVVKSLNQFMGFPNPFRFVANLYVDMKHYIYAKQKDEKEWLEYHVSMLKMKMNNIDENSPEYIKLSKAIEFYEEKISKNQRKIDDYLNKKG